METTAPDKELKQLLVCTDDSPDSHGACAAALDLARIFGSKVYLLEVLTFIPGYELQPLDLMAPYTPQVDLELMALREARVKEHLETWVGQAADQGVDLEVRVRTSTSPDAGILEEAEEIRPDLIIMGRHGLTGLSRLLMGSVTARVIGHAPANVLVVPQGSQVDFQRILMGSDGSPDSAAAFKVALELAGMRGGALLAVSVAREPGATVRAEGIVKKLQAEAAGQGVAVEALVLQGRPFEAIVQAARERQVNLIVLGSHGRTGLAKLLMGSVAERVIGLTPCPVLVVKKR
jgi:nucleotide-binding universal stress UspA family protein